MRLQGRIQQLIEANVVHRCLLPNGNILLLLQRDMDELSGLSR